jgi:hypothetical protein
VLEAAVLAAADLPRITPNSTSSGVVAAPSASSSASVAPGSPSIIPSTGLDEQLVQETIKVIVMTHGMGCSLHMHMPLLLVPTMFSA